MMVSSTRESEGEGYNYTWTRHTSYEQLIEQQKTDQTLKKYWELAENPVENGKAEGEGCIIGT